jgi:hypothetical protein
LGCTETLSIGLTPALSLTVRKGEIFFI